MIQINKAAGGVLEIGGGANRNPASDVNLDARHVPGVDIVGSIEEPLLITSDEFDCVLCVYCLEHCNYRKIPDFLKECLRVVKPGGKAVFVTSNTLAQFEWLKSNPDGWDGKDFFHSASCIIFGDGDYSDNCHKAFLTPGILTRLFSDAGWRDVLVSPAGARNTDLSVQATKPVQVQTNGQAHHNVLGRDLGDAKFAGNQDRGFVEKVEVKAENPVAKLMTTTEGRQEVFAKDYFNGGTKYGGYAGRFRDFGNHEIVARKILAYKPTSVLELGCARGYVLKRIQDAGIRANGLEISKHCWLTRACDGIICKDFADGTPWPYKDQEFGTCFSQAVLEHVPESLLPGVIREMSRVAKRCVHGIDFGKSDNGFDRSHVTLRDKPFWEQMFSHYWTNTHEGASSFTILDKEELQNGEFPAEVLMGDGKIKLNLGSFTAAWYNGWVNVDRVMELEPWMKDNRYLYKLHDITTGLPYGTGTVSLITLSHVLEHFDYATGASLLAECRRVLEPARGLIRVAVPDARMLMGYYLEGNANYQLSYFDEVNDGCQDATTQVGKLHALLHEGHKATYDQETLCKFLTDAGFKAFPSKFRESRSEQMKKEALDMFPCLSAYAEGIPDV